ncbi:hypothetical protein [Paracoccus onubensis]|nr:hypothetical protein [Paracoccus onubensis]
MSGMQAGIIAPVCASGWTISRSGQEQRQRFRKRPMMPDHVSPAIDG